MSDNIYSLLSIFSFVFLFFIFFIGLFYLVIIIKEKNQQNKLYQQYYNIVDKDDNDISIDHSKVNNLKYQQIPSIPTIHLLKNYNRENIECSYSKRGPLFTPAEHSFYRVLCQSVRNDVEVFGKVRIADVLNIKPEKHLPYKQWWKHFSKISQKHFDYLLCDLNTLDVLCVIELNDSSHKQKKVKDRDDFIRNICKSANLPLVFIKAQASYNSDKLRNEIINHLNKL